MCCLLYLCIVLLFVCCLCICYFTFVYLCVVILCAPRANVHLKMALYEYLLIIIVIRIVVAHLIFYLDFEVVVVQRQQ